ncbi:MAG: FAD-containing oxidoreductase [Piscinibacter sp.]|uniref:FAD-containing oxidoreductase n=1 Tax=Piscinibacter sp. TaxID=1903157 RepID=UPI00258F4DAF|nr:FAD-containing oxidoreductase [Piscinibacter sp.]MCW5663188.1 FAD-containing oxidoreductase [Piscinibacter sp.]
MATRCDAIVIGSGQAGPFLAARLAAAGRHTVLIEREHLGGTCVNDGCIPTKTMVASARAAHVVRRAAEHGVTVGGPVGVDLRAVKARKDRVVAQSVDSLTQWLTTLPNLRLIRGHARFIGPREVKVGGETLAAPQVFINVGGRALHPDWPGIGEVRVLDNTSMMALETLPEHLVVVGASYIGLEFAQMFRRFGAQVTVLEAAERAVAREDPEVSRELQSILEREGVAFHFGVRGAKVARGADGGVHLALNAAGVAREIDASHLLAAIGRRPNTHDLGLERAGIATDARGFITVDDQLRTSVEGVWALGDCNGRGAFTHTAYNDHEIVADNLLAGAQRRVSDRIPAYALFTDPPLGRIGMSEAEVRAMQRPALVGVLPMSRVGRARERGETQGFMKVLVDARSERLLGAALLGIEADEVVQTLLLAMQADLPVSLWRRSVPIHPTVSELLPTLMAQLKPLEENPR